MLDGSAKSIALSFLDEPTTSDAASLTNAASAKVMVRSATSSALAWLVAFPVSVRVTTVSLVRVNTGVIPVGTLETDTPTAVLPPGPAPVAKVSPVRVAVTLPGTEPSLAAASVKLPR